MRLDIQTKQLHLLVKADYKTKNNIKNENDVYCIH